MGCVEAKPSFAPRLAAVLASVQHVVRHVPGRHAPREPLPLEPHVLQSLKGVGVPSGGVGEDDETLVSVLCETLAQVEGVREGVLAVVEDAKLIQEEAVVGLAEKLEERSLSPPRRADRA